MLTLLKVDNVIETDFMPVDPNMNLKEMVGVISRSTAICIPCSTKGPPAGVVLLDEIRNIMFRPDLYRRMYVDKFMRHTPGRVVIGQSMEQVMKTFDDTGAWNLPVGGARRHLR